MPENASVLAYVVAGESYPPKARAEVWVPVAANPHLTTSKSPLSLQVEPLYNSVSPFSPEASPPTANAAF